MGLTNAARCAIIGPVARDRLTQENSPYAIFSWIQWPCLFTIFFPKFDPRHKDPRENNPDRKKILDKRQKI